MNLLRSTLLVIPLLASCAGIQSYEARADVAAEQQCNQIWTDMIRRERADRGEYLTPGQALGILHGGMMNARDRISFETCRRNAWEREYKSARALGRTCYIRGDMADFTACHLDKLDAHGYQPRSPDIYIDTR